MAPRVALQNLIGLLVAGIVGASCVVSPQPTPPDSVLVGNLIGLNPGTELAKDVIGFQGAPGAVDPPTGVVVVTDLDATDTPSIATVQPDGSFFIAVPGQPGETFRFQAKNGNARSAPFDVIVGSSGADITPLAQQPGCLALEPGNWLALDGAGSMRDLVLRNDCSGPLALAAPHLRRGLAGFSFALDVSTPPLTLAAGATATITVQAGDGAEVEDVLYLDATGPTAVRRAVTLTVPDR
jgi:hypothetical protein